MKRCKTYLALFLTLFFAAVIMGGCGNSAGEPAAQEPAAQTPAVQTPAPTVDPQADFICGAKELLSTDLVELLTSEEDGKRLVGMLSEILNDLNTRTAQTDATLTLSDIAFGGEAIDETGTLSLGTLHDAASGDSSLNVSLGMGTDVAKSVGIYINGDKAVLKPSSATEKIMLYTLPQVAGATNSFFDRASILLTGLLSDDGKASTPGKNMTDRQELCDRYLDPWTEDTSKEDYIDGRITMTLAGRQVDLRSVMLNLAGQEAYDFILRNLKAIQADEQFAGMDSLLGRLTDIVSTDIYDLVQVIFGTGGESEQSASIVGELVQELEALTPEEIAAAKFVVSVIFNGAKPIGIDIEASTTGKAFLLDGIIYRAGLEHEIKLHYQSVAGETASVELSTVSAGGENYEVKGILAAKTADGLETYNGGYTGTLRETDTQYDLSGNLAVNVQYFNDDEGTAGSGVLGGDLVLSIARDDAGYTGTGTLTFGLNTGDEEAVSLNMGIAAALKYADSVKVTPPMYTSANVTELKGKTDLWAIHQSELGDMQQYSGLVQDIKLLYAFLLG